MRNFFYLIILLVVVTSCGERPVSLTGAGIMSEYYIKDRLTHPNEVEFYGGYNGTVENDSIFTVTRNFDAKNSFGVKSSYVYKIQMIYLGGKWEDIKNWTYKFLIIENLGTHEKEFFLSPQDNK